MIKNTFLSVAVLEMFIKVCITSPHLLCRWLLSYFLQSKPKLLPRQAVPEASTLTTVCHHLARVTFLAPVVTFTLALLFFGAHPFICKSLNEFQLFFQIVGNCRLLRLITPRRVFKNLVVISRRPAVHSLTSCQKAFCSCLHTKADVLLVCPHGSGCAGGVKPQGRFITTS